MRSCTSPEADASGLPCEKPPFPPSHFEFAILGFPILPRRFQPQFDGRVFLVDNNGARFFRKFSQKLDGRLKCVYTENWNSEAAFPNVVRHSFLIPCFGGRHV